MKDVQDIIKLICISASGSSGYVKLFAGRENWRIETVKDLSEYKNLVVSFKPDVICIECGAGSKVQALELFSELEKAEIKPGPIVAAVFESDPGPHIREELAGAGCHELFLIPFTIEEFNYRIVRHLDRLELDQKYSWQNNKLKEAKQHFDSLKVMLTKTRKALAREKNSLNAALKQINVMTGERQRLGQEVRQIKSFFEGTVTGMESFLYHMIESQNETNKGHGRRVAEISEWVAKRLLFDPGEIEILKKAAQLHDVGMMFIPPSILVKAPHDRDEYEKQMFEKHPVKGAELLAKCNGFEPAAALIKHLHENVDGSGYPDGLKRNYIPLGARIIAGAELLDHLWHESPGQGLDECLILLEEVSGERLDPKIVNYLEQYAARRLSVNGEALKEYGLHQLQPGMRTGVGLFTATGTKLFSAGTVLTESSINMLIRYNREYPVAETVLIKVE